MQEAEMRGGSDTSGKWTKAELTYLADRSIEPVWHKSATENGDHWHDGNYGNFEVRIHDMRPIADELSLDRQGFMLLHQPTTARDLDNRDDVLANYYPEMEALVRELVGASRTVCMLYTIRDIDNVMPFERQFHRVHSDFTDENAPEWARMLLMGEGPIAPLSSPAVSAEEAAAIMEHRYAEYNVWRPINGPVLREPLAIVDASTVHSDDIVVCTSEAGNVLHSLYNPDHKWYYAREMENDEVLIFKCFDSARDGRSRFTFHTAFNHPDTPVDAPLRRSLDFRIFAFYDE